MTPSTRVILKGFAGDKVKKSVTITSLEEQPFKITDITSTIEDKIKYKLKDIEDGKKYNLEIKTRSKIKESFRGKVVLNTDNPGEPQLTLPVIGRVRRELSLAPQYLNFGVIDTRKGGKGLRKSVEVRSARGKVLKIEKIEPSASWITAEVENNRDEKKYSITIALGKDKLPKGPFRETITIHARYKKISEEADVIIQGKVI